MFGEHEGKKERHDEFTKGSPDNPWPGVIFDEFSEQVRKHGSNTYDLFTATTGLTEKATTVVVLSLVCITSWLWDGAQEEAALMESLQQYSPQKATSLVLGIFS